MGGDNALKHLNSSADVSGGLVRITLNTSGRTKFFLIVPELTRLATEAKSMADLTTDTQEYHHDLSPATTKNENKAIYQLPDNQGIYQPLLSGQNSDLYNLVAKMAKKDFSSRVR